MLFVLKVLLVISSYVFICFTKKHMWARILSICTGVSWILWTIIPHISSEVPKKIDLWQNILFVIVFIFGYMIVCFLFSFFIDNDLLHIFSRIGLVVLLITGLIIGVIYSFIHHSNIKIENKFETNVISSVKLVATNANSEVSGNLEGSARGGYFIFAGSTQSTINGTLTTEQIIEYWYYDCDGSVKFGNVPKKSIKIFFIDEDEIPYMDTVVETTQRIEHDYNTMKGNTYTMHTYQKEEVSRSYVFYVPEGSILEKYNFTK